MKRKLWNVLLLLSAAGAVQAAGFVEDFSGADLAPQSWMQTIVERCKGASYKKPLNGRLELSGVVDDQRGGNASLERDACYTTGDFHWTVTFEADCQAGTSGCYEWRMMSDNGETQLGAAMRKNAQGKWTVSGICGHTCKVLSSKDAALQKKSGKLEIIRRKTDYQLLLNGQVIYTASGDTAALASIRLTMHGGAGLTVKAMSLKKL